MSESLPKDKEHLQKDAELNIKKDSPIKVVVGIEEVIKPNPEDQVAADIKEAVEKVVNNANFGSKPIVVGAPLNPEITFNVGTYFITVRKLGDGDLHIFTTGAMPPLTIILPANIIPALKEFL